MTANDLRTRRGLQRVALFPLHSFTQNNLLYMRLFGGIRLSGCLLACREKKLDGRKRLHTFPHTLICLRAPAESPSSPLELKVKSFILSRKTMKREKKVPASPPGGNLSFPPRRTFTVAAQWRRQAAECVRKLRQLS